MPLPKFSARYPDVREVFDFALAQGGARYTLDTPGQAKHWRARAYAFRKVLWGEINASGGNAPTPYDALKITIEDCICVIHVETASARGVLEPLLPGTSPVAEANADLVELEAEAEALRKKFGIDL